MIVIVFNRFNYVLELENFLPVAMESSSPRKELNCVLLPPYKFSSEGKVVPVSTFNFPLAGCCNGRKSKKAFKSPICCYYS